MRAGALVALRAVLVWSMTDPRPLTEPARKRRAVLLAISAGITSTVLSQGAHHGDYWLTIVSSYVLVVIAYLWGRLEQS